MSAYSFGEDDEDMLTVISSCHDNKMTATYLASFFNTMLSLIKTPGAEMPITKKLYRSESGKNKEVSPSEWLK